MSATDTVIEALGLKPGHLFNAPEGQPILVPHGTRDVTLPAVLRAIGARFVAEIGVERGHFSKVLLDALPETHMLCVDAWGAYAGYREHVSQAKLDGFYDETRQRLAVYGDRALIRRYTSLRAAAEVPDGLLDGVYIDANHTLPHVIADLAAWVPKVRPGGIIAGHDFGRSSVGHVREAVRAWTDAYQISPWFVLAGNRSPSFLWVQP